MSGVSKFIPIDENNKEDNGLDELLNETQEEKNTFKASAKSLPAKQSGVFTKLKNILFYEIKVELTPYEQKVEAEINEFLHQEVTWAKFKDFLFTEVTFGKKNK